MTAVAVAVAISRVSGLCVRITPIYTYIIRRATGDNATSVAACALPIFVLPLVF
jgi:hypothetical protein